MSLFNFTSFKFNKIFKFIETCSIATPSTESYIFQPVQLFKHQKKYIQNLYKNKRLIVLKSKNIGETVATLCYSLYTVHYKPNSTIFIVSTTETDLQEKRIKMLNLFVASGLPYRYDEENIIDCGNHSQIMFVTLDTFFNLNAQFNSKQNNENTFVYLLDVDFKQEVIASIMPALNRINKANILITLDNRKASLNQTIFSYIDNIAKRYSMKVHYMNQYKVKVFKQTKEK